MSLHIEYVTDPEELAKLDQMFERVKQCEVRGHGELLVDTEGVLKCRDCEDVLDALLEVERDWAEEAEEEDD